MSDKKPEASVDKKPVQQEANVKIEEKKIEIYKVYGTDFSVQNPDYIEFYKARFKIMAVRYNLIGRVNNNSVYVIPNEIKTDLVNMPKEIEDMAEDYYTASCRYMKKYFYFKIKLTMLANGKAKASLYIYENIPQFFDDDYIITRVADYIDDYNEDFRVKLRKYFNLVDVGVPVTDFMVPNLAVLMQDNSDLILAISPLYEIASQIYLLSMIKLLENAGEVGEEILRRYYKLKESYEEELKNEKFKNTLLKILFDRTIDSFGGLEKLKINKVYIEKNVQEINKTIKAIEEKQKKFGGIEIINDKKEEPKKKDTPKASSSPKKDDKKKPSSPKKDDKKKPTSPKKDEKKGDPLELRKHYEQLDKTKDREERRQRDNTESQKGEKPTIVVNEENRKREEIKVEKKEDKKESIIDLDDDYVKDDSVLPEENKVEDSELFEKLKDKYSSLPEEAKEDDSELFDEKNIDKDVSLLEEYKEDDSVILEEIKE